METHVKVLGWLHILSGAFNLFIAGLVALLVAGGGFISGDRDAITVTVIVAMVIGFIAFVLSLPGIVAGIGLLGYHNWARVLALVLGILNLPGFPLGTVIGLYTLFVLLEDDASRLFNRSTTIIPA